MALSLTEKAQETYEATLDEVKITRPLPKTTITTPPTPTTLRPK